MASNNKNIKFKCPYCDKKFTREDLVIHVGDDHDDMIPENFTPLRLVFNYINKRPMSYHGKCTECGGPTNWDENKARYNRQCDNPKCKETYLLKFTNNMLRTKGVDRISKTIEGQEKMLANRKISGKYKFSNGVEKTYTGSYELQTLKFMDTVMHIDPDDLLCPGPAMQYDYEGKTHIYITDFYYIPYNLIIEVKDGGKNPNNRNMPEYRGKQIAKERHIIKNTNYNYLRLTDNDLSQLLAVFMDLKMQLVESTGSRVIHINEAMNALMTGYIPGFKDDGSAYIINYMQNNVFDTCISNSPKLDKILYINNDGKLTLDENFNIDLSNAEIYKSDFSLLEITSLFKDKLGQEVSDHYIYETLFCKKFYTFDQLQTEDGLEKVNFEKSNIDYISESISSIYDNSIKSKLSSITEEINMLGGEING